MAPADRTGRIPPVGDHRSRYMFLVVTHPRLPLILAAIAVLGMMTLILLL